MGVTYTGDRKHPYLKCFFTQRMQSKYTINKRILKISPPPMALKSEIKAETLNKILRCLFWKWLKWEAILVEIFIGLFKFFASEANLTNWCIFLNWLKSHLCSLIRPTVFIWQCANERNKSYQTVLHVWLWVEILKISLTPFLY